MYINVYKTKGGYYYKEYKYGKKRISEKEYNKKLGKVIKKQSGGNIEMITNLLSLIPAIIMRCDAHNCNPKLLRYLYEQKKELDNLLKISNNNTSFNLNNSQLEKYNKINEWFTTSTFKNTFDKMNNNKKVNNLINNYFSNKPNMNQNNNLTNEHLDSLINQNDFQNYIKKWQDILYLNKNINSFHNSTINGLLVYRWGDLRDSDSMIELPYCKNGIEHFDGLNGTKFYNPSKKGEKDNDNDKVLRGINDLRKLFIYNQNALNVPIENHFAILDAFIYKTIKTAKTSEDYEYKSKINLQYKNVSQDNICVFIAILLSMFGMFTSFLKTNNKYLLWFQNKAVIRDDKKHDLNLTIKHFIDKNVEGAYIAALNNGNRKSDYFNTLDASDVEVVDGTDIKYIDISKLHMKQNSGNTCVLLRRDIVINFLKWWKDGVQLQPEQYCNYHSGIPNLSVEDTQLKYYLRMFAKTTNFKVVIPFKSEIKRRSYKHNYQSPLISYDYKIKSSFTI